MIPGFVDTRRHLGEMQLEAAKGKYRIHRYKWPELPSGNTQEQIFREKGKNEEGGALESKSLGREGDRDTLHCCL